MDMVWHHGEGMQPEEIQLTRAAPERFEDAASDARVREPQRPGPRVPKLLVHVGESFSGAHPLLPQDVPDVRGERSMQPPRNKQGLPGGMPVRKVPFVVTARLHSCTVAQAFSLCDLLIGGGERAQAISLCYLASTQFFARMLTWQRDSYRLRG